MYACCLKNFLSPEFQGHLIRWSENEETVFSPGRINGCERIENLIDLQEFSHPLSLHSDPPRLRGYTEISPSFFTKVVNKLLKSGGNMYHHEI